MPGVKGSRYKRHLESAQKRRIRLRAEGGPRQIGRLPEAEKQVQTKSPHTHSYAQATRRWVPWGEAIQLYIRCLSVQAASAMGGGSRCRNQCGALGTRLPYAELRSSREKKRKNARFSRASRKDYPSRPARSRASAAHHRPGRLLLSTAARRRPKYPHPYPRHSE